MGGWEGRSRGGRPAEEKRRTGADLPWADEKRRTTSGIEGEEVIVGEEERAVEKRREGITRAGWGKWDGQGRGERNLTWDPCLK